MTIRTLVGKQEEGQEERPIQLRSADPVTPSTNQTWLNTAEKRIKFFDGASIQPTVSSVPNEPVVTKTINYAIQPSDGVLLGDSTAGDFIFTLPPAAANAGKKYIISKINSANKVVIDGNGAELVDGRVSIDLNRQYQAVELISDGAGWSIISSNISRYGKHVLSAAVSANGAMADLTFNNLIIGKSYKVHGSLSFKSIGTVGTEYNVAIKNGATVLVTVPYLSDLGVAASGVGSFEMSFEATATSVTFEIASVGAGQSIEGTVADAKTYAVLEENNMNQQTIEWD